MTLTALVTAGGTREPIDDVRVLTNLSRGWFGAAIARALVERGVATTLLGSRELLRAPERLDPRLTLVPFESYADLAWELERHTGAARPDLLFMAAAVSDYTPVRQEGKLPSSADELTLTLRRTPKLLAGLRARCGPDAHLVGFKLLSGVSRDELVATALRQSRENALDLTVANDLQDLAGDLHPVVLVTPEGATVPLDGRREEVARRIVDVALRRRAARRPELTLSGEPGPEADPAEAQADALARLAADAHLAAGLVAQRSRTGGLWVAAAGRLAEQGVHVALTPEAPPRLLVQGAEAAPRAAALGAWLLPRAPGVDAFLRVGGGLVLEDAAVDFPYPAGSLEEAGEVHQALARAARAGRWRGGSFAVRLGGPEALLGLSAGDAADLSAQWAAAAQEQVRHLEGVGASARAHALEAAPVLEGTRVVGVVGEALAEGWTSLFVLPHARGRGLGDRCAEALDRRGARVGVHEACHATAWWLGRGWRLREVVDHVALLDPPSRRVDLQPAASACLVDALGGRVLLGRRRRAPWQGCWSFPGGRPEAGEDAVACALREVREEAGVEVPVATPAAEHVVVVGAPTADGPAFRIASQVFLLLDAPTPTPSDELEPEWVPLDEALARSPMAPGTRRVLRALVR
ncbi:MAG: NUDIX domain-containing protein [Planctomycetes bacterium]|nr:NUDIX domain-containing protein [Planctomycetota bacterium]